MSPEVYKHLYLYGSTLASRVSPYSRLQHFFAVGRNGYPFPWPFAKPILTPHPGSLWWM